MSVKAAAAAPFAKADIKKSATRKSATKTGAKKVYAKQAERRLCIRIPQDVFAGGASQREVVNFYGVDIQAVHRCRHLFQCCGVLEHHGRRHLAEEQAGPHQPEQLIRANPLDCFVEYVLRSMFYN